MPYKTRYGKHYHETLGCHGADIPCSTEGLEPCSDCCGGGTGAGGAIGGTAIGGPVPDRLDGDGSGDATEQGSEAAAGGPLGNDIVELGSASEASSMPVADISPDDLAMTADSGSREESGESPSQLVSPTPLAAEYDRIAALDEVTFDGLPEHYHEGRFSVPGDVAARGIGMLGIDGLGDLAGIADGLGEHGGTVSDLLAAHDMLGGLATAVALSGASDPADVGEGGWAVVAPEDVESAMDALRASGIENPNAFRIPGNLRLVCSLDGDAIDISRGRDEMTAADIALAMSCTRRSANGPYQLLHYDQLACYVNGYMGGTNAMWRAYDGFLTELRGTVYDTRDMSIVSNPYYKFRNLNECEDYSEANLRAAIKANGGQMVATEKLDGSLIQLRYVADEDREGGAWREGMLVSTSNTLEGSGSSAKNEHLTNVERMYVQNPEDGRYRSLAKAHPDKTLCFEFVRPDVDPHVVTYDESDWGMWLTGMRDVRTGRLASCEEVAAAADAFGIPHPRVVATNIDDCLRVVNEGDGARMEGMVVDVDGWLVKMKLTDFLSISHIHHSLEDGSRGFRDVLRMTHEGTIDDALGNLPAPSKAMVDGIIERAGSYHARMASAIDSIMAGAPNPATDRPAFARWVREQPIPARWRGYLFARADGKDTPVYYADRRGDQLRYLGRNELAEREAELERWLSQRHGK